MLICAKRNTERAYRKEENTQTDEGRCSTGTGGGDGRADEFHDDEKEKASMVESDEGWTSRAKLRFSERSRHRTDRHDSPSLLVLDVSAPLPESLMMP